jgi:uncharacterized cupredoxin-like copper-binding protein
VNAIGRAIVAAAAMALLAMPACAADWQHARTITVAAEDYRFVPNDLVFQRGVAYRLHLENRGKELHWFHAPEFFRASRLRNPDVLNADKTEIEIRPGGAKDLYLVPQQAGHYPLICPDHDWAGMTGAITVR